MEAERSPSPPRPPGQRVLFGAMLVAGIVVVAFIGLRILGDANDLRGDEVLVIEKAPEVAGMYVLNVTRTQEEVPGFADLLDLAWLEGRAISNDPQLVADARAYMDRLAQEEGAESFTGPPFQGTLLWGEGEDLKPLRLAFLSG